MHAWPRCCPGWGVTARHQPAQTIDAELFLAAPDGSQVVMVGEVKTAGRATSADATAEQARRLGAFLGRPALVIADFANPALRRACLERQVGYLDDTGWVYVHSESPALFINHQGAGRATPSGRTGLIERLDGPGASQVIQTLYDTQLPVGVRELAARAGVSPGTVAKILPALVRHGAVVRDKAGPVTAVAARALLERWTQDYSFTRSNRQVQWLLAPRGLDQVLERLHQLEDPIVATGSHAARHFLPAGTLSVTPLTLLALYTGDPARTAEALRLREVDRAAANVVLAQPRDNGLLHGLPPGAPLPLLAPVARVLADLLTLGGRFVEEAEQVLAFPSEPNRPGS